MGDSGEYLYVLGQEAGNSLKGHAEPDALQILDRADDKWDPNLKNSQVELELLVYRENELRKTYHMLLKYRDTNHVLAEMIYPPRNEGEKMPLKTTNDMVSVFCPGRIQLPWVLPQDQRTQAII